MRARTGLSIGVIIALAVAIWVAISQGDDEPAPTTLATTTTTSTTTTMVPPTTFTTVTTTSRALTTTATTETTTDPEARVEEVRMILQDLYYGWFDAIYRNDEEAVRNVIATQRYLDDFRRAVTTLEYPREPTQDDIVVTDLEILRATDQCLVTYSTIDLTDWLGEDATVTGVNVLLPIDGEWRLGTAWVNKHDLWQGDCEIEPDL